MTTTFLDKQQKSLLKKYHTLCAKSGISESEKCEMVASYGVASSRELTAHDLLDICNKIEQANRPDIAELDKWRKRLLATLFEYLRRLRKPEDMDLAKAIACRATGSKSFNKIPLERLRSLYNGFRNSNNDLAFIAELTADEFMKMTV
jgi:hypothetical protein